MAVVGVLIGPQIRIREREELSELLLLLSSLVPICLEKEQTFLNGEGGASLYFLYCLQEMKMG